MRARRIGAWVLLALAAVATVVALLAGYARMTVLDGDQFAERTVAALRKPAVRDAVAREITAQAINADRDLVAIRPLVESAAGAVVGTPAFQSLLRTAARDLHRTVFTHDRSTATLTIANVGVLLASALERLDAEHEARLPPGFAARISAGAEALDALDAADVVAAIEELAWLAAAAAVLLIAGAIALAPQRQRAVVQAGIAVALAGGAVTLALQIGRAELLASDGLPLDRAAAGAVWDAFLGDLATWALVTLGAGTIVAAAAASLLRPVDVRRPLARAWALVSTVPRTPWLRVARAVALIAAGALIVVERQWMLDVALVLAGVFVLYQGVEELLRMIAEATAPRGGAAAARDGGPGRRPAPWVAGGVAAVGIVVLLAALVGSGATRPATASAVVTTCNGHAELCDRPLNEVAFAATHNAMSGYEDWLFVQHEAPIGDQLRDGVRALMIDVYFGRDGGGKVLTELTDEQRRAAAREIGPAGARAALRVRDALLAGDAADGPRGVWMCHGFCEVGARPLVDGLREVTEFVVAHPDAVVLIIFQDEGPRAADIAEAVEESGLAPFVWRGRLGPPWPTMREMIDAGGRVALMFEHGPADPRVPWYHDAYAVMQETPYHFTRPSEMSCAPNRGPADADFFLINHWIDTSPAPRPSNAAKVNVREVLLRRARRCERVRGLMPNVLAVDFYRTGDLLRVVDELNGVAR